MKYIVLVVLYTLFMLSPAFEDFDLYTRSDRTPVPDTSSKCTSCKEEVEKLDIKWESEDSVEQVVADLKEKCKEKFTLKHFLKREVCDKVVETFAKIPPQIFEGMEGLAWDIPVGTCATLKKCKMECCDADAAPEQLHLSLAAEDRSLMGVSWVTLNKNETVVQYGLSENSLDMTVTGGINTYTQAGWIGNIHKAIMTDLQPATTYYYRVGSPSANNWSEVYPFKTFDPAQKQQNFAVIADMGYGENSDNTIQRMIEMVDAGTLDVVIHSGDISYADGFEPHWDVFFNKIQPIAARIPYMVTPGNHEFWYNFAAYKARFFMPSVESMPGSGSGDNMYYSWKYGQASFVAMNSETAIDTQDFHKKQLEYVQKELEGVDRATTPFVVTHFHRPLYCSNEKTCTGNINNPDNINKLTKLAEEMFYSNQIDLCLVGHVHEYERTLPVYQNKVVSKDLSSTSYTAPIYILQGASGNREGNKGDFPQENAPAWSVSNSGKIGYGIMTIDNAEASRPTMHWSFRQSDTNDELDSFTLEK